MGNIKLINDFDEQLGRAVNYFWETKAMQINRQGTEGSRDRGNRGAVTGGRQLDGFVKLVKDNLLINGIPENCIFSSTDLELPGYYRPNKKWDLLVVDRNVLIAAIEFKSQSGPSFGNNFNNRAEEAMGSALDIWTAYREGVFGSHNAPWLGYFIVLENCPGSNEPVHVRSPHFRVLDEYVDASYMKRYEVFCSKLMLERQYNAACLLATSCDEAGTDYTFSKEELSCRRFVTSLISAALAHFE